MKLGVSQEVCTGSESSPMMVGRRADQRTSLGLQPAQSRCSLLPAQGALGFDGLLRHRSPGRRNFLRVERVWWWLASLWRSTRSTPWTESRIAWWSGSSKTGTSWARQGSTTLREAEPRSVRLVAPFSDVTRLLDEVCTFSTCLRNPGHCSCGLLVLAVTRPGVHACSPRRLLEEFEVYSM